VKQDKQDRRSQRTRQLVTSAMMELLTEKRYEAITIQDILDRAGIGRTTFYTHYFDKEDVHASMLEQMLEKMTQELPKRQPRQGIMPSLELFQHIQQDHKHFQAIAGGPTAERLWETMQTALGKTIEQGLKSARRDKKQPTIPIKVMSSYLSGAFLNLLKWWLKSGMPYTPEEMDEMFRQLALPGVEMALHYYQDNSSAV
jgi:AcrR family transcriptional regulator